MKSISLKTDKDREKEIYAKRLGFATDFGKVNLSL